MPKQHLNSHSLYQTELLGDQHATLKKIETNTKNINVNVGDVEINVADLEGLVSRIYVTRRDGQNGYEPENNISRYVIPTATPF